MSVPPLSGNSKIATGPLTDALLFRALFANSLDAIGIYDEDGRLLDCNTAALEFFGAISKHEVLGTTVLDISPVVQPDGTPSPLAFAQRRRALIAEGRNNFEWSYLHRDGSERLAEVHLSLIESDGVRLVCASQRDVTQERRVGLELQQSEARYRRLYFNMAQGVVHQDADGRILDANPAAERILGMDLAQLRGKQLSALAWRPYPGSPLRQHPSAEALERGAPMTNVLMGIRSEADDVLRWVSVNAIPEFETGSERPSHVVTTLADITERQQSEMLYRSVIESSSDAFVAVDHEGRILEWSRRAERMFGHPPATAIGRALVPLLGLRRGDGGGADGGPLRRLLESANLGKTLRLNARRRDGTEFPVETLFNVIDLDGELRITGFMRDISEAVLAERQLAQAQKLEAIGQLTGGLAHDFNNMLGIIIGSLDYLSLSLTDAVQREMLDAARDGARRAADVTASLLAVARRHPLKQQVHDINRLISEMAPLIRQSAGKQVEASLTLEASPHDVVIDAGAFSNALINLVLNARDAMPLGGRLSVYTFTIASGDSVPGMPIELGAGMHVLVGVDDTGTGMTPEVVHQAFDPFFTTKPRGKGTGLGLAMVYGFARQSGGIAWIQSTPGRGTSVQMVLPAAGANEATPA